MNANLSPVSVSESQKTRIGMNRFEYAVSVLRPG
jgi:hypothetical protein